jgi:predicted lipopolysaccharide heptosyltransferase III
VYKIVNRKKLLATLFLDSIGKALFWPWKMFRKPGPIQPESIRSILLIRTAYIGDVIMTLPMLRPLKARFPQSSISFLTAPGAAPLLEQHPLVDEVIPFAPFWFYPAGRAGCSNYLRCVKKLRQRHFDLLIEARGDIREILFLAAPLRSRYKISYGIGGGAYLLTHEAPYKELRHKVEYHLDICRFLGCPEVPLEWGLRFSEAEREQARQLLAGLGVQPPYLCAHPGSRLPLKIWPAEYCAVLYDQLMEKYDQPLLLFGGSKADQHLIAQISSRMRRRPVNLAGRTGLRQMAVLLEQASLFICNDSAPMHIAAALNVPTVAVFGPSKSVETRPFSSCGAAVEKNFPCRFSCDENACSRKTVQECMQAVLPEDVLRAAETLLAK